MAVAVKPISEASLRRLPLYHRYLVTMQERGRQTISCPEIGAELDLDPTQIRKDLETAGISGRPKVGYRLNELITQIEHFLGWDNAQDAFLAGVGHLGMALLGYDRFSQYGLSIVAGFDTDPAKVGTRIRGKEVLDMSTLPDLAQRMHVHLGIIAVPSQQAQSVAALMIAGGIRAIWNFAPVRLQLPPHIIIHNEDLYCSLASLSQKLAQALRTEATTPAPQKEGESSDEFRPHHTPAITADRGTPVPSGL